MENFTENSNTVYLSGTVATEPVFSHQVFGEGFYECKISVSRLSDQVDLIPVTLSDRLIQLNDFKVGKLVCIDGQFRSYNKIIDGRSKLMLTVFVREVMEYDSSNNPNSIEILGYICKDPVFRTTPFKREICDILVAVNRAYNKSDYIPCITWGRNARYASTLTIGEKIALSGRIQSREYQKVMSNGDTETRVAYEISVSRINPMDISDDERE
ncbi:MAG: single-stranded DNA-binding protein [Bacillota bacterium]